MKSLWPFTFFPDTAAEKETKETATPVAENSEELTLDEDTVIEEIVIEEVEDEEDDSTGDYDDLAFALEVDLEEAARIEANKAHKRNTIAVASLAILGAAGLATGFALRAYFKKRK